MLTDIHSHNAQLVSNQNKVFSLQLHPDINIAEALADLPSGLFLSAGVHPWHASEWGNANDYLLNTILEASHFSIIGEVGLDKVCKIPMSEQRYILEFQLRHANMEALPVLIHNVGCQEELLALKKKYKQIPSWIIHGFRGKEQAAKQYLSNGFHLSFGPKYQPNALRICPMDRLFLETDDSNVDLTLLYERVAQDRSMTILDLEKRVAKNFELLCIKQ